MEAQSKTLSIAAMICGIAGFLLSCFFVGIFPAIAGLILSITCILRKNGSKAFYTTGLITSACSVLLFALMIFLTAGSSGKNEQMDFANAQNTETSISTETQIAFTESIPKENDAVNTEEIPGKTDDTEAEESPNTETAQNSSESTPSSENNSGDTGSPPAENASQNAPQTAGQENTPETIVSQTPDSSNQENNAPSKNSGQNTTSSGKNAKTSNESGVNNDESDIYVYIPATGKKYHSIPDCGNMNPNKATKITEQEAISRGYGKCKNCH